MVDLPVLPRWKRQDLSKLQFQSYSDFARKIYCSILTATLLMDLSRGSKVVVVGGIAVLSVTRACSGSVSIHGS